MIGDKIPVKAPGGACIFGTKLPDTCLSHVQTGTVPFLVIGYSHMLRKNDVMQMRPAQIFRLWRSGCPGEAGQLICDGVLEYCEKIVPNSVNMPFTSASPFEY